MKPIIFNSEMILAILDGSKTQTRRVFRAIAERQLAGGWLGARDWEVVRSGDWWANDSGSPLGPFKCPYGRVGDRLWVRETIYGKLPEGGQHATPLTYYKADDSKVILYFDDASGKDQAPVAWHYKTKTLSARFMQKRFARIFLEITNIRVERVQDISEEDAIAEGVQVNCMAAKFVDGKWQVHPDDWCFAAKAKGCKCEDCLKEYVKYPNVSADDFPAYSAKESFQTLWDSINLKRGYGWEKNLFNWALTFKKIGESK